MIRNIATALDYVLVICILSISNDSILTMDLVTFSDSINVEKMPSPSPRETHTVRGMHHDSPRIAALHSVLPTSATNQTYVCLHNTARRLGVSSRLFKEQF